MACSDINRITHDMLYRLNLSDLFFFLISNKISQTSLGMRNIVATHRSTYTMCINFATTAVCRVILHLYVCVGVRACARLSTCTLSASELVWPRKCIISTNVTNWRCVCVCGRDPRPKFHLSQRSLL